MSRSQRRARRNPLDPNLTLLLNHDDQDFRDQGLAFVQSIKPDQDDFVDSAPIQLILDVLGSSADSIMQDEAYIWGEMALPTVKALKGEAKVTWSGRRGRLERRAASIERALTYWRSSRGRDDLGVSREVQRALIVIDPDAARKVLKGYLRTRPNTLDYDMPFRWHEGQWPT